MIQTQRQRTERQEGHGAAARQRLSGVDTAFLYLESKEIPLHIAGVCVFESAIPFKQFVRSVASRLHRVPRYRQVVVWPPYDVSYPCWEDDPDFDIRRHIFRARLEPPGGQAQLEELAGRIFSQVLDRSKPLWDMHVVEGLEGGRGALILRAHHAVADGIAGAGLLLEALVLDRTPEGSPIGKPPARPRRRPPPPPSLAAEIVAGIRSSLEHLIAAETSVMRLAETLANDATRLEGVVRLLPELVGAVERLPFNRLCGSERKFCWAEFDFAEVQAIRAAAGGSVNDVILTVLTRAIARYVELHGQTVTRRLIRVICPVNRRRDNGASLGNQITFMPVVLPMDVKNPVRMLQEVAARTSIMKRSGAGDLIALLASLFGIAPPAVQKLLWRGISQVMLPLPLFNIICTNIPGSPEPLYCLGKRMLAAYPQVPTGYELGINCAVQTYGGKLFYGLIADAEVAGDVTRLRDFLYIAFDELSRSAGVRKAGRRTRPAAAKSAAATAAGNGRPRQLRPAGLEAPASAAAGVINGTTRVGRRGRAAG